MKISVNLSYAESLHDRFALTWAVPTTIIGLVALFFLCRATFNEYHDYLLVQHQFSEGQVRAADLRNQEMAIRRKLDDPAYRDLLRRAKFVNNLIDQRDLSLSELSARLAGLLPEDAHLTALALNSPKKPGDDFEVRMGITARDEDAVDTFLNDLEDSPDFKDVSITNEGFQEENSQGQQVSLICTARYLPGTNVEAEKPSAEEPTSNRKSKH